MLLVKNVCLLCLSLPLFRLCKEQETTSLFPLRYCAFVEIRETKLAI